MAEDYASGEQGDIDGIDKALKCLSDAEVALKSVRQHEVQERDEESGETPREEQPKTLADAKIRVREHFRRRRDQK